MTTASVSDLFLSANTALSLLAALLLLFVSGGVLYLSSVEWRDRRRRKAATGKIR